MYHLMKLMILKTQFSETNFPSVLFIYIVALACFVSGCAVPVSPSGGPRDTEGPKIIRTIPENEAVLVDTRKIQIYFDEYTDRNSVRQNIRLEPSLDLPFRVEFTKKRVDILFEEDLPSNTTLAILLGSNIADVRRNRMNAPYKLAFSTGAELAKGVASVSVRNVDGELPEPGTTIYLFRLDDQKKDPLDGSERTNPQTADTENEAMYVAEPDTSGRAWFSYLSDGEYTAIWFDDLDRDRIWDSEREPAQPLDQPRFTLLDGDTLDLGRLYLKPAEPPAPILAGIGVPFRDRLRLRFNTPVIASENAYGRITSSANNDTDNFLLAWPVPSTEGQNMEPNVIRLQSERPLLEDSLYTIEPFGFSDPLGREPQTYEEPFLGNNTIMEEPIQYLALDPSIGLRPNTSARFVYSGFLDESNALDSLKIIINNALDSGTLKKQSVRNQIIVDPPEGGWATGDRVRFLVWNPFMQEHQSVEPEFWYPNRLGEIDLILTDSTRSTWNAQLLREPLSTTQNAIQNMHLSVQIDTLVTGQALFSNLIPGEVQLRLYQDRNANGVWDAGSVSPYERPEPYIVRRRIPVTEGFTTEVRIEVQ